MINSESLRPPECRAFARSTDAMVGGIFALIMVYLVPSDPRRAPRTHVRRLTTEISGVLREAAEAIVQDDRALREGFRAHFPALPESGAPEAPGASDSSWFRELAGAQPVGPGFLGATEMHELGMA